MHSNWLHGTERAVRYKVTSLRFNMEFEQSECSKWRQTDRNGDRRNTRLISTTIKFTHLSSLFFISSVLVLNCLRYLTHWVNHCHLWSKLYSYLEQEQHTTSNSPLILCFFLLWVPDWRIVEKAQWLKGKKQHIDISICAKIFLGNGVNDEHSGRQKRLRYLIDKCMNLLCVFIYSLQSFSRTISAIM